jgi:hypothetical protein
MGVALCRLCLTHQPLCDSHALPNSLFNYILRRNSGKAIVVSDDATTPAHFSSDTWEVELLCAECERKLNLNYDAYGIAVLRGHKGSVQQLAHTVELLNIDRRRLRMFILSVLWRISVSSHPNYSNIDLPHEFEEELRAALAGERPFPASRYTVSMWKMRDSTPIGGFSNEDLRQFIASPFGRSYGQFISVCFPLLGFFIEVFFPRVPAKYAKARSVLHGRSTVVSVPYIEVLDIPEIMRILVSALKKHLAAKSSAA